MRTLIGMRLKEERERVEKTQEELAFIGGTSRRTMIDWEQGKATPSAEFLVHIAEIGIDVQYVLIGVRAKVKGMTPEEQALLDNYRNADEEGQRAARRILDALAQQKTVRKKQA